MRRSLRLLGLAPLLWSWPSLADAIHYRCVKTAEALKQSDPKQFILLTIDPMLGEMTAERYLGEKLRSRTIYKIEDMDAAIIRGRKVRLGEEVVLELNSTTRRLTETVGGNETYHYDCEAPSSVL
jgi:hypothetical protein